MPFYYDGACADHLRLELVSSWGCVWVESDHCWPALLESDFVRYDLAVLSLCMRRNSDPNHGFRFSCLFFP